MNKVVLCGRLATDVSFRECNDTAIARYTLAVDRRRARDDNEADFIRCVVFGKSAEFTEKYFSKGMKVLVSGRIQTGSYENREGQRVYTTEVVVEEQEFCESKRGSNNETQRQINSVEESEPNGREEYQRRSYRR